MTRARNTAPVKLVVRIAARTAQALRVHQGDPARAVWLPLSQVTGLNATGEIIAGAEVADITLPRWLADEKHLTPQPQRGPGLFDASS